MGMRFIFLLLCFFLVSPKNNIGDIKGWDEIKLEGEAQGTTYHITYYSKNVTVKTGDIDSILSMIDSSMSIYKPYSVITKFNSSESGSVIDGRLRDVIDKSLLVYKKTGGLSDITIKPISEIWGFYKNSVGKVPDSAVIKSALSCVGSDKIVLKGNFLKKKMPCVKIDVDGIAQGYSVDVLALYFEKLNIHNYLIELGGEIRIKGSKQPSQLPIVIGIEGPEQFSHGAEIKMHRVSFTKGAITTSGNYRKYFESGGKQYSHIIDPYSGFPVQNELISATVYARDAITADAYDNAIMLMGLKRALKFVESSEELEAYLVYRNENGQIRDTVSSGFAKFLLSKN